MTSSMPPPSPGDAFPAPVATATPGSPGDAGDGDELADTEDDDEIGAGARAFVDWIVVVAVALTVAFLVRAFVLAHFVVEGSSMDSTLATGDRVFVNKLSYRLHEPRRGDVVVLHQISGASERDLIKRVIGLPGEYVFGDDTCAVYIDDDDSLNDPGDVTPARKLTEPYLDPAVIGVTPPYAVCEFQSPRVEDGEVFVLGDNRRGSQDSRQLGPIAADDLVGRAFVVFWPRSSWQWL